MEQIKTYSYSHIQFPFEGKLRKSKLSLILFTYWYLFACCRMIEYVDHLHEHFVNPVVMKNGNYQAPLVSTIGYFVLISSYAFHNSVY